jgi:hypothetical protein
MDLETKRVFRIAEVYLLMLAFAHEWGLRISVIIAQRVISIAKVA